MTDHRARSSRFSLLLGVLAGGSASLQACQPERPPGVSAEVVCMGELSSRASLVEGLEPAVELDSLALYLTSTDHLCTLPRDYGALAESMGEPCRSASDQESCLAEIERLEAWASDWGRYEDFWSASWGLLVATGTEASIEQLGGPTTDVPNSSCGSWSRGGPRQGSGETEDRFGLGGAGGESSQGGRGDVSPEGPKSRHVTAISDRETIRTLLGEIDTANEAALIMWSNDYDPPCAINRDGTDYVAHITKQVSDCPITNQDFEVRVHADGSIESTELGDPREGSACVGRRPDRLHANASCACRSEIGRFLSRTAHLEGSAVIAFAQLALQLREHGAPRDLVDRAILAAEDEVRHGREVESLCRNYGTRSEPAVVTKGARRTLLSLAVENAVEGCVRECWGALVAHYQAQHATDVAVRRVWARIAEDESAHALLSLDLARWFRTQLSAEENARVEAERETAVEQLFDEIAQSGEALPAVGLPDASVGVRLLRDLSAALFAPAGKAMSAA